MPWWHELKKEEEGKRKGSNEDVNGERVEGSGIGSPRDEGRGVIGGGGMFSLLHDLPEEELSRPEAAPESAELSASELKEEGDEQEEAFGDSEMKQGGTNGVEEGNEGTRDPKRMYKGPSGLLTPLVWIDLEMTGLDPESDRILQIAVLVTDGRLGNVTYGPEIAIHESEAVLESMNEWCVEHHGRSGLTEACRTSTTSLAEAEERVLEFVSEHTYYKQAQLAGNSIHVDLTFLKRYMPALAEHFHYRIVDVSTIGECVKRWCPKLCRKAPKKKCTHTAMSDIVESLEQLRFYKRHMFTQYRQQHQK